jgi:hypothetical protein
MPSRPSPLVPRDPPKGRVKSIASLASHREGEIDRTIGIGSPCPCDSITSTPVGRMDTTHGISGWNIKTSGLGSEVTIVPKGPDRLPNSSEEDSRLLWIGWGTINQAGANRFLDTSDR